jgi:hypothetical protein
MAVAPAFAVSAPALGWDPFQREALAELGYRVYCMRGVELPPDPAPVEASPRPARAAKPPAPADAIDPLLRALVRAAGTDALPQVELEALRRDPAAKRALWPRLRALRGAARTR